MLHIISNTFRTLEAHRGAQLLILRSQKSPQRQNLKLKYMHQQLQVQIPLCIQCHRSMVLNMVHQIMSIQGTQGDLAKAHQAKKILQKKPRPHLMLSLIHI